MTSDSTYWLPEPWLLDPTKQNTEQFDAEWDYPPPDFQNPMMTPYFPIHNQTIPSPPETTYAASSPSTTSQQESSRQNSYDFTHEASPPIILHERISKDKNVRRRDQNRASQRAYRDRQRKRVDELQQEIQELKTSCWELEQKNQRLTKDLERRWQKVLLELKSVVEKDASQQEAVGWMLKHGYGVEEAESGLFSVFSINDPPMASEREGCTLC